jgi:hypothetical protein
MTESEVVSVGKRRSRREINRLVVEFESSGLRQSEFCHKHGLALSTLQGGLKRRRREVGGQSESNPLMEVKVARTKVGRSGPETCALEVVLAKGRRIEVRRVPRSRPSVDAIRFQSATIKERSRGRGRLRGKASLASSLSNAGQLPKVTFPPGASARARNSPAMRHSASSTTHLDSRQAANALMTTIAYPGGE